MKKLLIFFLPILFLTACTPSSPTPMEEPSAPQIQVKDDVIVETKAVDTHEETIKGEPVIPTGKSAILATTEFDNCKSLEEYKKLEFFPGFSEKVSDFIVKTVYPNHIKVSGEGKIEELRGINFIEDVCRSEGGVLIVLIFYDYQMMGGYSYVIQYDTKNKQILPADTKSLDRAYKFFPLFEFGKRDRNLIKITGQMAEGDLVKFSALYDYINNIVYPETICHYPYGENRENCETFKTPPNDGESCNTASGKDGFVMFDGKCHAPGENVPNTDCIVSPAGGCESLDY